MRRNKCEAKDKTNMKCKCGGRFIETSIHDDLDGVLHCDKCNKKIKRYD